QMLFIVLDVSDPNAEMHLKTVYDTLDSIGATDQPRILALNKIDQLERPDDIVVWLNRYPEALPISASTGEGVEELGERALDAMLGGVREVTIEAKMRDGDTIAFIERRATVLERDYRDDTTTMRVRIGRLHVDQLLARGASMQINGKPAGDAVRTIWPDPVVPHVRKVPPHLGLWNQNR
ncbi:MAG: hypothetical protein KC983_11390, partial [Phycisphaerales bacterium]|nr:hypothetical protein [Phycisphaerales bacterium]